MTLCIENLPSWETFPYQETYEGHWIYYDSYGEVICYWVRYIDKKGKKKFCPWSLINGKWSDELDSWVKESRPIYNIKELLDEMQKPVLIVEGEKTADAAKLYFKDYVCVTWLGGSSCANKVNLVHFKDRIVFLFPDHDSSGKKAMEVWKKNLKNIAKEIYYIDIFQYSNVLPGGWDIADLEEGQITFDEILMLFESAQKKNFSLENIIDSSTFPLLSSKGNPINSYENLNHLLNFYHMPVRYNSIKKQIEVDIPHKNFTKANKAKLILAEITSLCIKNNVPRIDLNQWLMMIADQNSYNPVEEYILSKPWDGKSRINEFLNTINCENIALRNILVKKWMIGAIAIGLSKEGLAHPGVLTLCGPQYCGKSSWFQSLLPEQPDLILGDHGLNPSDKDSIISATRFWLTELSEVDGAVRKSDVSAMKSFLTRKLDVYRCPYDRADTEAPRNTAFVATVNDEQFLRDNTGNRRWWVLEVISMNAEHKLDMQQIWAEFYQLYLNKESYYLDKDEFEMLTISNKQYSVPSSLEEIISDKFHWDQPYRNLRLTATEVLSICGFDITNGKQEQIKECHRILRQLSDKKPTTIKSKTTYFLPAINNQSNFK